MFWAHPQFQENGSINVCFTQNVCTISELFVLLRTKSQTTKLTDNRIIREREKMRLTTKRHIASRVLLAVFVPMLLLSSLHIHETSQAEETACAECVQHQCHGHLTPFSSSVHQCVLCQFLTLTFVAAAVAAVICTLPKRITVCARHSHAVRLTYCGVIGLRAPPAF